ncbi:MAG TPA: hypothetical protein VGL86_08375, partial [Polyangia bacterium]
MKFTAARTSMFGAFAIGIAVVCTLETPILHVLVHRAPLWAHALIIVANVATIVWILGQRKKMRDAAVTLDDDALSIALPGRWGGAIPLALVAAARRIAPAPGSSKPRGSLRITPLEAPNVELTLRAPATLRGSYGIARSAARIQLFVDEPDAFLAALTARLATRLA